MLRDNYAEDKVFAEILQLVPCMDPALAQVDVYLEDDELFQLIRADFSKRWTHTLFTGRNSTPVEVILRMLVVKRLYQYSYRETERTVTDSLTLRQFCRVYFNPAPDEKTLMRWNKLLRGETVEKFNIHPPSDSRQLADSVRVLERTVQRARSLSQAVQSVVQKTGKQLTQKARDLARAIGEAARKRTEAAKERATQLYQQLVEQTGQVVGQARQTLTHLRQVRGK